jgi:hypothetical protein
MAVLSYGEARRVSEVTLVAHGWFSLACICLSVAVVASERKGDLR